MNFRKNWVTATICVILVLAILFVCYKLNVFDPSNVYSQVCAAVLSVAFTAIITKILLQGQGDIEERKNQNVRLFEKKLEIYSDFNEKMWQAETYKDLQALKPLLQNKLLLVLNQKKEIFNGFSQSLEKLLEAAREESVNDSKLNECKGEITKWLKSDIDSSFKEKDHENFKIQYLLAAFDTEEENNSNPIQETSGPNMAVDSNQDTYNWNNEDLKKIYDAEGVRCWHFAAWVPEIQLEVLKEEGRKKIICLVEYGEERWRSDRLMQIKPNDTILLFCRGGRGYVGAYRAIKTEIIETKKYADKKKLEEQYAGYDIYNAYNDGAALISCVEVEVIKEAENYDGCQPIGAIRQTILHLSTESSRLILKALDQRPPMH